MRWMTPMRQLRSLSTLRTAAPSSLGLDELRLRRATACMQSMVDEGRLPFARLLVSRHGQLAYDSSVGPACGPKVSDDATAVYRFFSSTKLFTSVAAAVLFEKYAVDLDDEVADYLGGGWAQPRVTRGEGESATLEPAARRVTIRDCLTHVSGLTYGGLAHWLPLSPTDSDLIEKGVGFLSLVTSDQIDTWVRNIGSLEKHAEILGSVPLKFEPGTRFDYAMGHIVVGRVIEVVTGRSLKEFVRDQVLDPLGCSAECGWNCDASTLLPLHLCRAETRDMAPAEFGPQHIHSCAAFGQLDAAVFADLQMVGRASDLLLLGTMLARRGETARGERMLSPSTVDMLTGNLLPGGATLDWSPTEMLVQSFAADGPLGFGLCGMTYLPGARERIGSVAAQEKAHNWPGSANTHCIVDPEKGLSVVFCTQLLSGMDEKELSAVGTIVQRVYQSLLDD